MAITKALIESELIKLRPIMAEGRILLAMLERALLFFEDGDQTLPIDLTAEQKQDIQDTYVALKNSLKAQAGIY